ncbi:MAG: hypothetical protein ACI3ZS_10415 [Candidatus Cryptobacteroides sp.]
METNIHKYRVAGHVFGITLPEGFDAEEHLSPYEPFRYNGQDRPLFTLKALLADSLSSIGPGKVRECLNDEPPYFWIFDNGRWNFGFSYSKSHPDCILVPSDDFSDNTLYVPSAYAYRLMEFAVSNAMMLLYTFNVTPLGTLLIHASVTVKDAMGYVFLGKSGTGKSTHSSLWLNNIQGTHLLNDDNPVIRVLDGRVIVYGSPWSGKTPCYRNEEYPLGGIVRLTQAPFNRIQRLGVVQSYAALMPSCSCMKWNREHTDAIHRTVESVVGKVRCWGLECLPDADAAHVCCDAVTA